MLNAAVLRWLLNEVNIGKIPIIHCESCSSLVVAADSDEVARGCVGVGRGSERLSRQAFVADRASEPALAEAGRRAAQDQVLVGIDPAGLGPSAQSRLRRVSGRVMRLAQRAAVETLMTTEQRLTVQVRWALRPTGVSAAEQGPSETGKRMTHSV